MTKHQRPHVPELARQDAPIVQPCTIALETVWLTMTGPADFTPGAIDLSRQDAPDWGNPTLEALRESMRGLPFPVYTPENYLRGNVLLSVDLTDESDWKTTPDGTTIKIQLPPLTIG